MITLETKQLAKRFGNKTVFSHIDINFQNDILGIGGPNGSGKSTLLKCLAGLLRPSAGSFCWDTGDKKLDGPMLPKEIGFAAPYINHYSELSVKENLAFISSLRSLQNADSRIDDIMQVLDIFDHKDGIFGRLSSGQQQRVKLAAALIDQPKVLFLDEPGTNLDKQGNEIIKSLIRDFVSGGGTVILASNNEDELELCDQVFLLKT
ncbi:MAG: ABC transporter ATP-binding protein [Balneolales bacterium]